MLDKFPMEGGQKDPKQRIIPFLPGKRVHSCKNHAGFGMAVSIVSALCPLQQTNKPVCAVGVKPLPSLSSKHYWVTSASCTASARSSPTAVCRRS